MAFVNVKEAVEQAWQRGTAILAINAVNLETAQGVVRGAERAGRPVILMVSHNAARYGGLEELYLIGRTLARKAEVPVYLHYDHAEDLEDLERAYALGFDSAMLEVRLPPLGPEGQTLLREARSLAGSRPLEVELEAVEKGGREGRNLELEDLLELVRIAQPDWLVVNLGTVHKSLKPQGLDLERLHHLKVLGRPFVLHGGSSAPLDQLLQAIALGIAKVNLATAAYKAFTQAVRERVELSWDPREYLGPGREALAGWLAQMYRYLPPLG